MEMHKAIVMLCSLSEQIGRCDSCVETMKKQKECGKDISDEDLTKKLVELHSIVHRCNDLRIIIEDSIPEKINVDDTILNNK